VALDFLDAQPVGIDAVDQAGAWAHFRVDDSRSCMALLRQLRLGDTPLSVGVPHSAGVMVALWAVDDVNNRLHFSADALAADLQLLMQQTELWAAAYQGDVKLQFPLEGLVIEASPLAAGVGGGARVRLEADLPTHIYRLPRRLTRRVRRGRHRGPQMSFRHPLAPDQMQTLSALDISLAGCALWKPATELPLAPGTELLGVEVQLDEQTFIFTDMTVQHVTLRSGDQDSGARVGCSWLRMPAGGRKTLQNWLGADGGARQLMKLTLD